MTLGERDHMYKLGDYVVVVSGVNFEGEKGSVTDTWASGIVEVRLDSGDVIECGREYLRLTNRKETHD